MIILQAPKRKVVLVKKKTFYMAAFLLTMFLCRLTLWAAVTDIADVRCGGNSTAIILKDGTLWTCGENKDGQLGNGNTADSSTPVKVASEVKSVSLSGNRTAFVKKDGTLWMSGSNKYGEFGNGTTSDSTKPVRLMSGVKEVSTAFSHTAILKTDGTLWTCGCNDYGELGEDTNGILVGHKTPIEVLSGVKSVDTESYITSVLKPDGTLWMCGDITDWIPGNKSGNQQRVPLKIISDVAAIEVGGTTTAVIKTDHSLWMRGYNTRGELGKGDKGAHGFTEPLMTDVKAVSCSQHTAILKTDGSLWMCGDNYYGQLGDGTTTDRLTPVKVMTGVKAVSVGNDHTAILKTDGSLWMCGRNDHGQLGDGTTEERHTPVRIDSGKEPDSVSIQPVSAALEAGETIQLEAAITPSDAADQSVTWKSSNKSTATVSTAGLVEAKKAGTATITVLTSNGKKASCTVTVTEKEKPARKLKKGDIFTDEATGSDYRVTIRNKEVEFYAGWSIGGNNQKIPATISYNGVSYKVTSIRKMAFSRCMALETIIIGKNVKTIGSNAFDGCKNLKTVKGGKGVTGIGERAFYGCKKLTNITIGAGVTSIGKSAFENCTALKKITIPASVNKIGQSAFKGCKKLKYVTIKSKKLTGKKVGSKAFAGLPKKTTIKVPKKVYKAYKKWLKKKGVSGAVMAQ